MLWFVLYFGGESLTGVASPWMLTGLISLPLKHVFHQGSASFSRGPVSKALRVEDQRAAGGWLPGSCGLGQYVSGVFWCHFHFTPCWEFNYIHFTLF